MGHNETAVGTGRGPYSMYHIQAAASFAKLLRQMEEQYKDTRSNTGLLPHELDVVYKGYATGAIFSAVSFLEASINELFVEATDEDVSNEYHRLCKFPSEIVSCMANLWRLDIPRTASFPILNKYQVALTVARRELFDKGRAPYQNVTLVVQLRNRLIHFEPEYLPLHLPGAAGTGHSFEDRLIGKFALNPWSKNFIANFFPEKCLGYGCAKWATESVIDFANEFFTRMDVEAYHSGLGDSLKLD